MSFELLTRLGFLFAMENSDETAEGLQVLHWYYGTDGTAFLSPELAKNRLLRGLRSVEGSILRRRPGKMTADGPLLGEETEKKLTELLSDASLMELRKEIESLFQG